MALAILLEKSASQMVGTDNQYPNDIIAWQPLPFRPVSNLL